MTKKQSESYKAIERSADRIVEEITNGFSLEEIDWLRGKLKKIGSKMTPFTYLRKSLSKGFKKCKEKVDDMEKLYNEAKKV